MGRTDLFPEFATAEKRGGKWVYVFVGIGELDEILTLKHYSKTK